MPDKEHIDDIDLDLLDDAAQEPNADEQEDEGLEEAATDEGQDDPSDEASKGQEGDGRGEVKPQSRGERRIQALARELKERKDLDAKRDQELAELKARFQAPAAPDPELERQRLAMMTPEERMQHQLDAGLRQMQAQQQQMAQMQRDSQDRLAYETAANTDPRRARLQAAVEQVYQEQLRQGRWVPRETVYFHELGKRVASQAAAKKPLGTKEGEARLRRQQASLGSGRGDVASERGRGARSFEDKYGDVPL